MMRDDDRKSGCGVLGGRGEAGEGALNSLKALRGGYFGERDDFFLSILRGGVRGVGVGQKPWDEAFRRLMEGGGG